MGGVVVSLVLLTGWKPIPRALDRLEAYPTCSRQAGSLSHVF